MKRDQNTNGPVEPLAELPQEVSVVVIVIMFISRDPAGPEPAALDLGHFLFASVAFIVGRERSKVT